MEAALIVLGGAIAMISVVITQVLVNRYQRIDAERKRKWEIEDRKYSEQRQLYLSRVDQVEEYVVSAFKREYLIRSALRTFINGEQDELTIEGVDPLFQDAYVLGLLGSLDDSDLIHDFGELIAVAETFAPMIQKIKIQQLSGHVIDRADRNELAKEFLALVPDSPSESLVFGRIITRLDNLRVNYKPK